jgi:hypothetical protein
LGKATGRRTFIGGVSLLALSTAVSTRAGAAPSRSFAALSATLLPGASLDPDLATSLEKALRGGPDAAAIGRLLALAETLQGQALLDRIKADGLEPAAGKVVAAWYSGIVAGQVITYTDALAWNAVPFTKPNGYCGSGFGYWAQPPAG